MELRFFRQDAEQSTLPEPNSLVSENSFLTKKLEDTRLPTYEEIKDMLPKPVWDGHSDYIDCYSYAWKIAFGNLCKPREGTGFVSNFIDTAFNGCIFMWDSSFILMFGKYANRIFNFQGTLDNFYSHQHRDGYICREIEEKSGLDRFTKFDPASTGPNIMPWCEWEYYLNFADRERLEKVFSPLLAYHNWMKEHRTWRDGAYWSSGWGCGMDNLPRVQEGYSVEFSHSHMVWVDACMQELANCNIFIEMARILGRDEFISELEAERDNLERVINEKLWDEETGFYYDLFKNGELNHIRHIGAFWALTAGCASPERAKRLVWALEDERDFKAPNRVPSLSRSDLNYIPHGAYWMGGVWAPTTYMVLRGLDKYGEYRASHEIARDYLYSIIEVYKEKGTLFENYAPEFTLDGKPSEGNPAMPEFVGWTGLGPISILFENIFGIKPNAHENKIVWDVRLLERHGVEQYPFGCDGELTLICAERSSEDEMPEITFKSNIPVTVEIIYGSEGNKQYFTL